VEESRNTLEFATRAKSVVKSVSEHCKQELQLAHSRHEEELTGVRVRSNLALQEARSLAIKACYVHASCVALFWAQILYLVISSRAMCHDSEHHQHCMWIPLPEVLPHILLCILCPRGVLLCSCSM
jgi:hypothetical protein